MNGIKRSYVMDDVKFGLENTNVKNLFNIKLIKR